jgi:hypothetical protein
VSSIHDRIVEIDTRLLQLRLEERRLVEEREGIVAVCPHFEEVDAGGLLQCTECLRCRMKGHKKSHAGFDTAQS